MGGMRGSLSVSLAVVAAGQLLFNPLGHAQEPAAPPPPQAPPQGQGQPGPYPNAAPPQPYPYAPQQYPYAAPYPHAQPYPPVYGPIVTLRADSPRARLQVMTQLKWQDVCVAPCNVPVHPGGTYRIGGGSVRGSEEFTMPRSSGQVVIDAQVGSKVKRGIGIGLTIGGAVSALAGGLILLSAADSSNDPYSYSNTREETQLLGVFYLVIGAVLMAIGIPLSTSSTSVTVR